MIEKIQIGRKRECKNCDHFLSREQEAKDFGQCRAHSPHPCTNWPVVKPNDWCGDYFNEEDHDAEVKLRFDILCPPLYKEEGKGCE